MIWPAKLLALDPWRFKCLIEWSAPSSTYNTSIICVKTWSHLENWTWKYSSGAPTIEILSVIDGSHILMRSSRLKNLYILEGTTIFRESHVTTSLNLISHLWHYRLDHMNGKTLNILQKHSLLLEMKSCKFKFCEHGVFGKHTRITFNYGVHNSHNILEYIHSHVWITFPTFSQS